MKQKQPWLSILIPTYNGEAYLASTLNSIIAQGDSEIECIVVDDGSTDATLSILHAYRDKLPLKLLQRERQGNWVASTNYALSIASSDYVCLLHQDDVWLKDRLIIMKAFIEKNPNVNVFLHPSLFIDIQGNYLGVWRCPLPAYPALVHANMMAERLLVQNFISIPAPIFRREIALKVKGLDETLWYTADWDFWLKITSVGEVLYYPKPLSGFRIHPDSQTFLRSASVREFQQQLEIVLKKHFDHWQSSLSNKRKTWKAACFSIKMNTALAGMIHEKKTDIFELVWSFLALGILGWIRYFRDSRIWERVSARLKARLKK